MKITDKEYFLPEIYALSGIKLLGSGTTQPMLIRGVCTKSNVKEDYVVKYIKSPRMSPESSCRELIAAFIAKELEMNVADPATIIVTDEFVETLIGKEGYKFAQNSLGLNFGCKYVPGMMEILINQPLTNNQYEQAERIFALDIFISNADRNHNKQNMLTDGEKILIFDHELAFGFVMDIIKNSTPWILSDSDKVWVKNHFFYQAMKEGEPNFDTFVEKFEVLNENFWNCLNVLIPEKWRTQQVDEIKSNLTALIENKGMFLREVYKIVS